MFAVKYSWELLNGSIAIDSGDITQNRVSYSYVVAARRSDCLAISAIQSAILLLVSKRIFCVIITEISPLNSLTYATYFINHLICKYA